MLEAYSIDTCNELPAGTSTTFSDFAFRNVGGAAVARPVWTQRPWSVSPSCNYQMTQTAGTATRQWNVASQIGTPGDELDCCPFAIGCACMGTQLCNASGTAWGQCFGATRVGLRCPD